MFRRILLFAVLLAAGAPLFAQDNGYQFSHLDITNGLSDNQVNCIFKDPKGFIWFGTTSGLNRYDGYKFKVYKRDSRNSNSLRENHVMQISQGPDNKLWIFSHSSISIYDQTTEKFATNIIHEAQKYHVPTSQIIKVAKDNYGRYWFITKQHGVYRYDQQNNSTLNYDASGRQGSALHSNQVIDIVVPAPDRIWLIYSDGIIEQLDTQKHKVITRFDGLATAAKTKNSNYIMMMDKSKNFWIGSDAAGIGAFRYNTVNGLLTHFGKDVPGHKLNANLITSIIQADDNNIWIGTDHGGINIINAVTSAVSYIMNKPGDDKSLSGNSVSLYKDNTGIIWAGTFKQGIDYYHSGIMQFPLYKHLSADPKSLPYEDINSFEEDAKGNLWIGTNGNGLLYYNRTTKAYKRIRHDAQNTNTLANDIVVQLYIDRNQRLWIGTYFGGLDCYDGKTFKHYRHNEKDPSTITDDRVYTIIEDAAGKLWAGTYKGGLNVYDPQTDSFKHPKYPLLSDYTSVIYEDRNGNKWIGHDKGVDVIDYKINKVRHYTSQAGNVNSLVGNDVNTITQDKRGLIWIGTKDGLSILNTKNNRFLNIDEKINLPANNVSNVVEDRDGKMWVSTMNGLSVVRLSAAGDKYYFRINNYNERDGLQGRAFNLYAAMPLKTGELVFGGVKGFNIFDPLAGNVFKPNPTLIFTEFSLFGKPVAVGDTADGQVLLKKTLSETNELILEHNQNVFDIEFAACDYFNPEKIRLEYKMDGFDKGWTVVGPNHKATYTNLDAGKYIFKVRAHNSNGGPVDGATISLKITVRPPFFKSPLAYVSYLLILLAGMLYIRHRGIMKLRREFDERQAKAEIERKATQECNEARRTHQLDLMKIKFFTNISHEFRTPLSLVLSPIENLIKISEKPEQQSQLLTIKRNGKRLLNLVNQLLDFRKMEYNELKLNLSKGEIIKFIKEVSSSFNDIAQQKGVEFLIESELCAYITDFDHDKLERILFNLLSNAFKFTPAGGHISVMVSMAGQDDNTGRNMLEIKVIDTGIGIPHENQEKIFERFFQDDMPENLLNQGSGIGLSITKEFVKMQGGHITIESEPDYGSCFTVVLPVGIKYDEDSVDDVPTIETALPIIAEPTMAGPVAGRKPTVLLIEDNEDLRFYLKDNLKNSFHIIEAVNGKDGWKKALAMHPNLIVSDISMPEMNGIELCKKIKADPRTCEIPVLLLTALATEENQLTGLESGANDYIVKPFNFEILLSKINNALKMQQTFKQTYQKQMDVNAKEVDVVSEDDKFLKTTLDYIEENITNVNLSVEELARYLNLNRVSLYKKLLRLTGKTPVDCIRTIRLQRAVQLLEKSNLSIASVAYQVGFNNPAYFAKVFREEYGLPPSEFVNRLGKTEKPMGV